MVCYAQRAITMSCIALVAFLLLGRAVTHSIDVASLLVSVSAVVAGTALAATIAFFSFRAVRHRRALAGGCVACTMKCQHAMTEVACTSAAHRPRPTRLWLISTADRGATAAPVHRHAPAAPVPGRAPATRVRGRAPAAAVHSVAKARGGTGRPDVPPAPHVVPLPMPHWPDRPLRTETPSGNPVPTPRAPEQRARVAAPGR